VGGNQESGCGGGKELRDLNLPLWSGKGIVGRIK